ncbi:MAG: AAA domain-containing protein [Candidatus Acidiferrales bacterium]
MVDSESSKPQGGEGADSDGIKGFATYVLRYFQDFIETDFHRQQVPRRRIILKNDVGFRMGIPLRKYPLLLDAIWKACRESLARPFELRIPKGRFTAPLSPTLRDLIRQQVDAIPDAEFEPIKTKILDYAVRNRVSGSRNAEKFSDDVSIQFVEEVGQRIVARLLSFLEEPFKQNAYSAIESVYDVEADLTDAITASAIAQFPLALNTLIISGDSIPLAAVFDEFFTAYDVKRSLTQFFEEFSTADIFLELRDLDNTLRTAEGQSLYLYMYDIRFGTATFPVFYIPLEIRFDQHTTTFILTADPHLYVNKRALDWIVQETSSQSGRTFVSPALDRILYLSETESFADIATKQLKGMIPALDVAADLDMTSNRPQKVDNATMRMSNSLYLAVFDRADESILSDYEALLSAVEHDQMLAQSMFENIVRGMILAEPLECMPAIEKAWGEIPTPDRLIASSPIPINEEQRKIQIALQTPDCRYIIVQGPPGTGKSHTITALAFDAILNGKNILILSDKQEALDVVEDKLAKTLEKVRHGSADFPNPILRLGKTSSYPRLIASASLERIKEQDNAQKANASLLDYETKEVYASLRSNVEKTISAYSTIRLTEISELNRLEMRIDGAVQGFSRKLREPQNLEALIILETSLKQITSEQTAELANNLPNAWMPVDTLLKQLNVLRATHKLVSDSHRHAALELFSELTPKQIAPLSQFILEYEKARWPVFGFLFTGSRVRAISQKLISTLPCTNPLDLHKKVLSLRTVVSSLSAIQKIAGEYQLADADLPSVYRWLSSSAAIPLCVPAAHQFVAAYIQAFPDHWPKREELQSLKDIFHFALDSARYAIMWHRVSATIASAPRFDYIGEKSRLETLYASRMSREIDHKFVEFVGENRALARSIGGVIKAKKQFPTQEFERFGQAFPCIIAGIREYAQYVPLKNQCFDVVVIDEAS